MSLVDLLHRYQSFDPATGRFDVTRTDRDYAALLGTHAANLSRIYAGKQSVSLTTLRCLLRAFPQATVEVMTLLAATEREAVPA